MRNTESLLRQLIREALLREAALTPDAAVGLDLKFIIDSHAGHRVVFCVESGSRTVGALYLARGKSGPCLGAYEVVMSNSLIDGLGPLLYDIALEMAGADGIMSDRKIVSNDARSVWKYYGERRGDVDTEQLDSIPGVLTPDYEEDDCEQRSAAKYGDWKDSPLSKVYRKGGTETIRGLLRLGILEIRDDRLQRRLG